MPESTGTQPSAPSLITPEIAKRIEESRQRARALRDKRAAATSTSAAAAPSMPPPPRTRSAAASLAGTKRPLATLPDSNRDGTKQTPEGAPLRPAKKFAKYVEYNMSAMTDTRGGFLAAEDDPNNAAMRSADADSLAGKPKNMSVKEWERLQLIRKLERQKQGPFEPGISVLQESTKICCECSSRDIDFVWDDVFKVCVCFGCKEKFPDKYSLLTKTECREDYLLTDEELKDADLLPHLNKPNPHKAHWHDMMLFLRFQVEEYAFNTKWGSAEALDQEFEKREAEKKRRKEAKFKERLRDLKRKTRTETARRQLNGEGPSKFGDSLGGGKHVHNWGRTVENEEGMTVKKCLDCGMEVEELEF